MTYAGPRNTIPYLDLAPPPLPTADANVVEKNMLLMVLPRSMTMTMMIIMMVGSKRKKLVATRTMPLQ